MAFKGIIEAGSRVTVALELDATASGPAAVTAAFARSGGGGSHSEGMVVASGTSDSVALDVDAKGMLQIFVDMAVESDSGTLDVRAGGEEEDRETIEGDTLWTYAVVP